MLDRRIPRVYKENDETTAVVNILRIISIQFLFLFISNANIPSLCNTE